MVKEFQIGKWYKIKKPGQNKASSPSKISWHSGYDSCDGKVLRCEYVFFDKKHAFLGTSRRFGFHAEWVEGPFDSKEEGECLGNFVGSYWDPDNNSYYNGYKNEIGTITELKQPNQTELNSGVNDVYAAYREGLPSYYANQVSQTEKSERSSIALDHKSNGASELKREMRDKIHSLELRLRKSIELVESRLDKFKAQNFDRAFQGKDGKLYCVTSDNGLHVYDDAKGEWALMMPSDSLSSTELLKANMKKIDEDAERDIDEIIEKYNKRRAADLKHRELIRKNFNGEKPAKASKLPLWLMIGLGTLSATTATLGTIFFWPF